MGRPPSCLCGKCSLCGKREASRKRYWENREKILARHKERRESGELARYEMDRYNNNEEFRMRKKARNMVRIRVARGTMVHQPCEVCGGLPSEAHHDDYSKPLDVRWLCPTHHLAHHHPEIYGDPSERQVLA